MSPSIRPPRTLRNVGPRHRPALDPEAAGRDRGADGVGVRLGVDQRIRRAELTQPMDVAVADERLAIPGGPAFAGRLKSTVAVNIALTSAASNSAAWRSHASAQAASQRKERVRRHDEPRLALSQPREIVERVDVFSAAAEVQAAGRDGPRSSARRRESASSPRSAAYGASGATSS